MADGLLRGEESDILLYILPILGWMEHFLSKPQYISVICEKPVLC